MDVNQFLNKSHILLCHCAVSSVVDKDQGHVLTSDFIVIKNNMQRKIIISETFRDEKGD